MNKDGCNKNQETYVLLPGDHCLQLCQTEQQDNLVIAAVEMSFPGVLSKARQREVRKVSFNYAKVGVIFYISCWVIFYSTYSNQRLTFIDIFPLRRVYSTPVAGHIHGLSEKLFASILRLGCVVILPSKFLGL